MEKFSNISKIAAWILVVTNLMITILCVITIAFGLWCIAAPHSLTSAIEVVGSPSMKVLMTREVLTVQLGVGIIAVSSFLFFISFMGLHGAISRSPFMLFMYTTLIILLLLLECALVYYFSSNFNEKGLRKEDDQWSHAMRLVFKCCDYNATLTTNVNLPWSCCGESGYPNNCTTSDTFNKDCKQTISNWFNRYETAIYITLAVLHILLASCSLIRRSRVASHSGS
ncbi:hypothetical protein K1T71_014445 [Dendrolimus kikuchii]|uniref:Uncharacterized protein n=1 Tax=Dendrolimus kikuchii TaxID=765133 RepID=A0ACC1CEF4_9NEOP|nr:hypothetical protein K1T71_014445 [Dendrolimus kikuchii]